VLTPGRWKVEAIVVPASGGALHVSRECQVLGVIPMTSRRLQGQLELMIVTAHEWVNEPAPNGQAVPG